MQAEYLNTFQATLRLQIVKIVSGIDLRIAEILVMRWVDIVMVPVFRLHSCQRIQNFLSYVEESDGIISSGT